MLHVTCDICGKDVTPAEHHHYVVKIEVYPAQDPSLLTEADLDADHMEEVSQLLRDMEAGLVEVEEPEPTSRTFRYDLCIGCQKKFVRDLLSKEAAQKFDFSEN